MTKQEQADSRSEWRDNEDHVEINEIKIKKPIQLINEMCRQFLREIIKTDKPLANQTEMAVLIKSEIQKGDITIDTEERDS